MYLIPKLMPKLEIILLGTRHSSAAALPKASLSPLGKMPSALSHPSEKIRIL